MTKRCTALALMVLCFASGVTEMAYARSKPKRYDQSGPKFGPGHYPDKPILSGAGVKAKNKVKTGAGAQRKGHTYIVKRDVHTGAYYHVYGRGKGARRVKLHKDVANAYGYPASS